VKDFGIKMGVPAFQVRDVIDQNNTHLFRSNYAL